MKPFANVIHQAGKLFAAGIIPGLLMALSLMAMVYYLSKKRNYPVDNKFSFSVVWYYSRKAFLPILIVRLDLDAIFFATFRTSSFNFDLEK